jgi:ATP-binding protein involved in chromosome partitioning
VLAEVPLDLSLRAGGDRGVPIVDSHPDTPAAKALTAAARTLTGRGRGLAGMQLGLSPAGRL